MDSPKGLLNALLLQLLLLQISTSLDTISFNQTIKDGEFLVSKNDTFVLGFFSPGTSSNWYVGIWYKFSPDLVVWVANRDNPVFDLSTIVEATKEFSSANMLGHGGFGIVYKGNLPDGQEIAVKRLSRNSGQGVEEFKNEVRLIAKLQHRNLVRLFGCCIDKEERMLIYEYMPNRSLDLFIFDKNKRSLLDWRKRFQIIIGIARGVLYLHQDSRLKIIHRDLKASNVLLDSSLNPKISDFGMARMFGDDQIEANTNRVVGTYGYMSPEYAMDGLYSTKSDVFSFGVLALEIICGKKNNFQFEDSSLFNNIFRNEFVS